MEDVNETSVRRNRGASKEKILYDTLLENTRRNMVEFGAHDLATRSKLLHPYGPATVLPAR